MPFLTYEPFPQCLKQRPLTPLLLARVTSEEVGAIYQTLSVSRRVSAARCRRDDRPVENGSRTTWDVEAAWGTGSVRSAAGRPKSTYHPVGSENALPEGRQGEWSCAIGL